MKRLCWKSPVTDYPETNNEHATISKIKQSTKDCYYCEFVRGETFIKYIRNGNTITVLTIGRDIWMTDEPQYTWCLESFAERSYGHVLVAGLGLGIVVHFLAKNKKIMSITVVEREMSVIDLIKPLLPKDDRLAIVHDDFYDFMKKDQNKRDVVIWDLAVRGGEIDLGITQLLKIKDECQSKYGKDCLIFRHGMDRDPIGEEYANNHPKEVTGTKRMLELMNIS